MAKRKMKKQVPKRAQAKAKRSGFWRRYALPGLLLFALPFLLYATTRTFGYVLDDVLVLSENNFVKKGLDGIGDIFTTDSFTGYLGKQQELVAGARYRPLSIATFAVEYALYGLNPGNSHLINVLLYSLTGLLIFRLLAILIPGKKGQTWYERLPFWIALLFVLHPIHTEVVANIKGRDEILVLLLSLSTLYFSIRYTKQQSWFALLLSGGLFLLALLAKENAVTFLAVIPLSIYLFTNASLKTTAVSVLPLLLSFGLYLLIRVNAVGYLYNPDLVVSGIMNDPYVETSVAEKYATITYTLGQYLKLLVFPHPLTHDYYPYQVPILNWVDWRVLVSLAANLALLGWGIRSFRKRSIPAWSILFYFSTLSIVSNIVISVGAPMNERFVYVSSLGFCTLWAYLFLVRLPAWQSQLTWAKQAGLGILLVTALAYAGKTYERLPAWKDAMSLNRAAIKVSTNSARANSYMAYSLYQRGLQEQGAQQLATYQEALPYVNRALEIYPTYSDALTCKGGLLGGLYQQNRDLDQLLEGFYEILSARHINFIDQYMVYLNGRENGQRLAQFYHRAGYELMAKQQKQYALALQYLNYGLEVSPDNVTLLEDLAEVHALAGKTGQAQQMARRALQLNPQSERARAILQ